MKILWGDGKHCHFGRIEGTNVQVERSRDRTGKKWKFLLSDDQHTYLYVDDRFFNDKESLELGVKQWLSQKKMNL
ncbi:MAG: hypothetical protein GY880_03065 [Planctomycetaceae bacterium]|jgi:hypothetical protein|nr:hypothetical protein [Planctomycetaceae bacterium]